METNTQTNKVLINFLSCWTLRLFAYLSSTISSNLASSVSSSFITLWMSSFFTMDRRHSVSRSADGCIFARTAVAQWVSSAPDGS